MARRLRAGEVSPPVGYVHGVPLQVLTPDLASTISGFYLITKVHGR